MGATTIQSEKSLVNSLKEAKEYDQFLDKIQQSKMEALWANKEDEAWEST